MPTMTEEPGVAVLAVGIHAAVAAREVDVENVNGDVDGVVAANADVWYTVSTEIWAPGANLRTKQVYGGELGSMVAQPGIPGLSYRSRRWQLRAGC